MSENVDNVIPLPVPTNVEPLQRPDILYVVVGAEEGPLGAYSSEPFSRLFEIGRFDTREEADRAVETHQEACLGLILVAPVAIGWGDKIIRQQERERAVQIVQRAGEGTPPDVAFIFRDAISAIREQNPPGG